MASTVQPTDSEIGEGFAPDSLSCNTGSDVLHLTPIQGNSNKKAHGSAAHADFSASYARMTGEPLKGSIQEGLASYQISSGKEFRDGHPQDPESARGSISETNIIATDILGTQEDFSSTPCPPSKESHHEKITLQTGDAHGTCDEDFTSPAGQPVSASFKTPSLDALLDFPEAKQKYFKICVPLYKAAVEGDWEAANRIMIEDETLLRASITKGWQTVLHVAAGAKHVHFVKELLKLLDKRDLELQDQKGNTALYHAVAAGTLPVAKILMQKNPRLLEIWRGQGLSPLYYAAFFGHGKMALYLYPKLIELVNEGERGGIFFSCINNGLYELALKMLEDYPELAVVRSANSETALHLLAQKPSAFAIKPSRISKNFFYSCTNEGNLTRTPCSQFLRYLWENVLRQNYSTVMDLIRRPSRVLFTATKLGNFKFVAELISSYPDLIWETDDSNQSLFLVAVAYHQASIFKQAQKSGSFSDIVLSFKDDKNNNILHLAAKLAPPNQLNTASRSTIQMKQDLLWFKEVKKVVPPFFQEVKNTEGKTPRDIFIEEHKMIIGNRKMWIESI